MFQKSEGQLFDQVTKDVKSMFTFEKWPLVSELKWKVYKNQQIRAVLNFSSAPKVTLKM